AWSQSKKAEAGTRPAQYGVPGAWSQPEEGGGGDEAELGSQAGTRPERLSSTNVESQVRDLGPKKVKVGCLKPEEGELQEEATTSSKDLLSEYVLGAWSQPEEDRGGDKVRGLNLKRMEAGTRPEHFSSTNIGSEVRGLNSNRKLKLKKTEVWKFKLKKTQAWKLKLKKGKDKAGRVYHQPIWVSKTWGLKLQKRNDKVRILKKKKAGSGNEAVQARLHGAWSQSKKAEAGTRPAQYGVPGAWSQPEEGGGGDEAGAGVPGAKAEAGTRPERLSSTNVESQVRDLGPKKVKVGCLKPEEGELQEEATTGSKDLLSEYVLGAWSQPEEDGGGDKAGSPILNCHGFPGSWSGENRSRDQAGVPILKQYGVPGARSQLEEDGGGNQAGALVLNQYRVRGAWSQLEQDGGEERPEYLCKDKAGRAHPQPTWGSEVRKFKLKKTQVWKFKLKKTEAWKLKLKKGKDKAWKLKLKETEAWKLKLKKGKNKAWKLKLKKGKNKAWTLKRKKTEARRRPGVDAQAEEDRGVDAQAEEDRGKEEAWKLKRKKTEARTRRTLKETESPKASHGECKEYARYLGIDPGYEGEETHNAMLCPSLGAWSQPEKNTEAGIRESEGGDKAGALILNQGEDEAGALTLNQYGVPGVTSRSPKKLEVRGLNLKKAEGTRPEGLSSTNMGSQPEEGEGGDEAGVKSHPGEGGSGDEAKAIILNKSGVWKLAEEVTGKDEAGSVEAQAEEDTGVWKLKRKKTEVWKLKMKKTEARTRPGVEAQAEEDRGKDEVWKHKLKKTEARRDLGSVQQDPAMLSEQSSGRYIVSDDVELPEDRVQYSDVNLLRQALLDAREFLRSGYTEIHFRVWRRDEPMKLLCARSAKQHEGTMELYLTYEDGGEEEGLLHPAGTGCTGPLFAFASRRQDGIPAPRRRLGRAHTIFFFKNDLVEWTAARGEAKRCKEGLVHHMRPRSSIMSQSGIQVLSLSGNNVGEGRDEAGALILNQDGVSGAWSEAEKTAEAGGDEAGALIINQDEVSGAWSQAEEGEGGDEAGGDEAGALVLNQDGVSGAWSQAEDGGGRDEAGGDEAGALILNQDGVSGAWSEAEKTAEVLGLKLRRRRRKGRGGDEAGALILNQYGVSGAWPEAEKTAGKKGRSGGGGDEGRGRLSCNQDWGLSSCLKRRRRRCVVSQPQDAGGRDEAGGDEAGALILNLDGVSGAWSEAEKTAEAGTKPERLSSTKMGFQVLGSGAWSQAEEDGGGGDEVLGLKLRRRHRRRRDGQAGVPGVHFQLEEGGGGDEAGGDKAEALILNPYGVPGAWSPLQEDRSRDEAGLWSPLQEDRGGDKVPGAWFPLQKIGDEDGSGDKAGTLVLNQYRVPGAWFPLQKIGDEAGADEAGVLVLNQYGVSGKGRVVFSTPAQQTSDVHGGWALKQVAGFGVLEVGFNCRGSRGRNIWLALVAGPDGVFFGAHQNGWDYVRATSVSVDWHDIPLTSGLEYGATP
ncbi:unnamed protein product, partial [Symbiodinium sp. CCMP2592]